jgi:hypothetical protein
MKLFMSSLSVVVMRKIRQKNSKRNFGENLMNHLCNLYRVVLTDNTYSQPREIVEYEYGESELEALEHAIGKQGFSVTVKSCEPSGNRAKLLEAARSFKVDGCMTGRLKSA